MGVYRHERRTVALEHRHRGDVTPVVESTRQVPSLAPYTAINVDKAMYTPGSGTTGLLPMLPPSICERAGPYQGAQPLNVALMRDIIWKVSTKVFHEQIVN